MRKNRRRQSRLDSGRHWIKKYEGKSLVKGYSKKYGVDKLCAIKELRMLGVEVTPEYEHSLKKSLEANNRQKQERKERKEKEFRDFIDSCIDSDDQFAMIIGYTSNGAPYGITDEEYDEILKEENQDDLAPFNDLKISETKDYDDNDELPF